MEIKHTRSPVPRRARLALVPDASRRPVDRDDALRRIRDARRRLATNPRDAREGRFTHLKRMHD